MSSLNKDSYFCYMYKVGIWVMPLMFKTHKALQWSLSFKYSIIFNMGALLHVYWMTSLQLCFLLVFTLSVVGGANHHDSKNVFKSTRKVLSGVYFPGPFFPSCFREFQRDWYKHFDLVLDGVSSMPAMLKLRDVEIVICWEVYTDYQGCTFQNNTPVLLLYQVTIII